MGKFSIFFWSQKEKNSTSGIFGITLRSDVGLTAGGWQREYLDGPIKKQNQGEVDFFTIAIL